MARGFPLKSFGESSGSGEPQGQLATARQTRLEATRPAVQNRVIDAVEHLARTGEGDVMRLVDVVPPEYRLRVGDWRVRFARDEEHRQLDVLRVLPRGKAYR